MRLWVASLCFYLFVFALCEIFRFLTRKLLEERATGWKHQWLLVSLIYEFIGTLQICIPMFDVNLVMDNYGFSGVFVEIGFIEFVNAFLLRNSLADPCSLFYEYAKGRYSLQLLALFLSTQFTAAYASYFVAIKFFAFGLHPQHLEVLQEECSADLTVTIIFGSIVEALGLIAGKIAEYWIDEQVLDAKYITLTLSICSGLITILGINLTGMYANPIVAWALTFNCGEVSYFAHFAVYWLTPFVAFVLCKMALTGDDKEEKSLKKND